jgi:hypothetical protein
LIRRHLGRAPQASDGVPEATLRKAEKRLQIRLPRAMRDYYLLAGAVDHLNRAHHQLFSPDRLRIEDGHLWFMEENQAVVRWGLPLQRLSEGDPPVYQRANAASATCFSENLSFSTFLIRIYDWQAGFADAPG